MTFDEFLDRMDAREAPLSAQQLQDLLTQLELTREDVKDVAQFSDLGYKRNVVRVTPAYAALLLCWKPGQRSQIHDHRDAVCGVRVVQGTATEIQYERSFDGLLHEAARGQLPCGGICASIDDDIHVVANEGLTDLITLHVYTPPMKAFSIYNLEDATVRERPDTEVARVLAGV